MLFARMKQVFKSHPFGSYDVSHNPIPQLTLYEIHYFGTLGRVARTFHCFKIMKLSCKQSTVHLPAKSVYRPINW